MAKKKRKSSSKNTANRNKTADKTDPLKKQTEKLWQLEKKQEKRKKRMLITTPIIGVLIIIGLLVLNGNKIISPVAVKTHSIVSLYDSDANETVYAANGSALLTRVAGRTGAGQGTLDGGLLCELTDNGGLVLASVSETKIIAENVTEFALAAAGTHILYATVYELYIYDVATNIASPITGSDGAFGLRISPDGSAFAYVRDSYIWMGTKAGAHSAMNYVPVSVANGGEVVYAISTETQALVAFNSAGEVTVLVENVDPQRAFFTNATGTQLICHTNEGPYLISGGTQVDKFGGEGQTAPAIEWDSYAQSPEGMPKTLFSDSLFGLVYNSYVNGKYSLYGVSMQGASKLQWENSDLPYRIRDNYSSAYYIQDDALYFARNSNRGRDRTTLIDTGISELHMSSDGERLYYLTNYGRLMVVEGKKTPKEVAENVMFFAADYSEGAYYIDNEGTLYSYNGKKSTQVLDGVAEVKTLPGMTLCYVNAQEGRHDVYAAAPGGEFKLVAKAAD